MRWTSIKPNEKYFCHWFVDPQEGEGGRGRGEGEGGVFSWDSKPMDDAHVLYMPNNMMQAIQRQWHQFENSATFSCSYVCSYGIVLLTRLKGKCFFFSSQDVTTGARNKIMLSIKKLNERPDILARLDKVSLAAEAILHSSLWLGTHCLSWPCTLILKLTVQL